MSIEFDIACLRAPCDPDDCIGVAQLIDRAKMAADQMETLINQRDQSIDLLRRHLCDNPKGSHQYCFCELCKDTRDFIKRVEDGK